MKKTLQEVVWDIEKWSDETFGKGQRTIPILHHLKKEVPELIEAIEKLHNFEGEGSLDYSDRNGGNRVLTPKSQKEFEKLWHNVYKENADCFMLLFDAAAHYPMTVDTIQMQMERKLEINKKRKWGTPDENGVVEHIKENLDDVCENCSGTFDKNNEDCKKCIEVFNRARGKIINKFYNPNNIVSVMLKNGNIIIPDHNQAFQEYPKRIELWQSENKLLRMVARWNTKSIVHYKYADSQAWELRRDYINPYHPATESELMLNQLRMFSKNKLPV